MTPREYIEIVVRPNLAELQADPANIRFAFNAVHSVDALAARIYVAAGGKQRTGANRDTEFRESLAALSEDVGLVRDWAKALKHIELNQGTPTITKASSIRTQPIGYGRGGYGEGRYGGSPQVTVEADSGRLHFVETVLLRALAFLEEEMTRRGL